MTTPDRDALTDRVTAGPGGAMTVQVGVITGDLTVTTTDRGDGTARVVVQYTGAEDRYDLEGGPVRIPPGGVAALHRAVLGAVRTGGAAQVPGTAPRP
ncbi:hypothetical protein [Streptomyces sp. MspMP-M5]|uniref:hypothetical protein n=1 Tax=unclassified Streptomyces TaxID=2593676 RepID=UPI0003699A60|nr:hypothetical protein [Streptomyces sp. MspMP-M5]MYT34060.1 hypothetical protein [Streptomyces sp. SID8354]